MATSRTRCFLLLLPCLLTPAQALFSPLGDSLALVNTSKPIDGFSVQDKLVPCNGNLVLIDLDSDASFTSFPPQFTLQQCGTSPAAQRIQQFTVDPVWGQVSLLSPPPYLFPATCMDGGGSNANISVYPWLCRNVSDPIHSNQRWTFSGGRVFLNSSSPKYPLPPEGLCISAGLPGQAPVLEVGLVLAPCDSTPSAIASQSFSLSGDGTIRHTPTGLCIDAGVIGRTLTWNGAKWTSAKITPKACPDAGNPALLPRDRIGAYTVGHTSKAGDPTKDRLLIVGGDDTSNNMYWSDDCGKTFNCFDGSQPWTTFGVSYAPLITLDALPGSPLVMAGGFDNLAGGGVALSTALYYTFDGGAGTWQQGYDLPTSSVFPGSLTQDRSTVYLFGGADDGYAVWTLDETNYNTTGFTQIPGSANSQGGDVGRRVYIRGKVSGGCFFATDFSPGVLWGGVPRVPSVSSSNQFSVASSATGPWATFSAPWAARASAAVVSSRDGTLAYVAGGVDFANGVPTGAVLTDAWAVDAGVCLLGSNGQVCSGHGTPSLDTVTCSCDPGFDSTPTCDGLPSLSPSSTATPTRSPTRSAKATATRAPLPPPSASGGATTGGLSPGAAAGLTVSLLVVAGLGVSLWVVKFGGATVLSALTKRVGLFGGAVAGEQASLLRAPGRGSPTQPLSTAAAAARFAQG